jgi:hypothetical protein
MTCRRIAEEAQESVLGPPRMADAGVGMVSALKALSMSEVRLRETVKIGRSFREAEGLRKVEGMLRALVIRVSRLE